MPLLMKERLQGQSGEYLPRLIAAMYCVFDPIAGPTVVEQVPEGSVATALSTFPTAAPTSTSSSRPRAETSMERAALLNRQRSTTSARSSTLGGTATDAVVRSTSKQRLTATPVLFDFSPIREFVIPKSELCGHLITKATRTCKILGFPIRIVDDEKYNSKRSIYNRNAFIFNVCFIFERDAELSVFEPVVRKVARTLRILEESSSLLSDPPPHFSMSNLLEQLYMDLNNFSEASIRIGDFELELFLSPFYANPKPIKNSDVPLAVCALEQMKHPSWDVTLYKVRASLLLPIPPELTRLAVHPPQICSFINGINHVKSIAELAQVDLHLARLSIQHLVFYGAVIIVDLFQYTNSYATLPLIADVVHTMDEAEEDEGIQDLDSECQAYVYTGAMINPMLASATPPMATTNLEGSSVGSLPNHPSPSSAPVPFANLLGYYAQLRPGVTVTQWCERLGLDGMPIDVRRLVQFGCIKGFLRRVYAYPVWLDHPKFLKHRNRGRNGDDVEGDEGTTSFSLPTPSNETPLHSAISTLSRMETNDASLPDPLSSGILSAPNRSKTTFHPSTTPAKTRPEVRQSARKGRSAGSPATTNVPPISRFPPSLPMMMDGTYHTDEICVKYSISFKQLEVIFRTLGKGRGGKYEGSLEEEERGEEEEDDDDDLRRRRDDESLHSGSDYGDRLVLLYV
ncbi:BZ3500_MvSof-1268-A1-R1_Chr4-4g07440 [Microbotryum saponariae]|uniref:BZ3500_MvSof-1268-A1-R1_Chr4-4g07440 protein n=1 Tax=Microbotryum saponariae TaxID=289078 RepID=A0A2X0LJ63_9BASI|nr:BZ3500_MvSof-1268-A1-R1_Chr4-4g07440 [Microbotryum saponariae]SDA07101.1 BZ3501_MvSof-1269-A2-R1_Chr4-3g07148 [Microbotryum saponariae]